MYEARTPCGTAVLRERELLPEREQPVPEQPVLDAAGSSTVAVGTLQQPVLGRLELVRQPVLVERVLPAGPEQLGQQQLAAVVLAALVAVAAGVAVDDVVVVVVVGSAWIY